MKNKLSINDFQAISIRGRFIYGYLCLSNAIEQTKSSVLPNELFHLCHEFVSSDKLDEWHAKVEELLPSFILDVEEIQNEYFSVQTINEIKDYYKSQPAFIVELVDDLFSLGISNLYVSFKSEYSLEYLELILEKMDRHSIELPNFNRVRNCSITERGGWGRYDDLNVFLTS